jgi:hypothetical protein
MFPSSGHAVFYERPGGWIMATKNSVEKDFLKTYQKGKKKSVVYLPLALGFLKLEYGLFEEPDKLCLVSFVLDRDDEAIAVGSRLEMSLADDLKESEVTYISENGVSGLQWSGGGVIWGHTYDDDSAPTKTEKIPLGNWVDKMIADMINPSDEEVEERRRLDREDG